MAADYTHVLADFHGVSAAQLRDPTLLRGLLVAAAGAMGLASVHSPHVRTLPNEGVASVLLLEGCHISVHTDPARELLLLDVLVPSTHDARKAVDVFTRRITAREITSETRSRG